MEIISKLSQTPYTIGNNFQPFVVPGFGFSKSNIGDEITIIDAAQPPTLTIRSAVRPPGLSKQPLWTGNQPSSRWL